MSYYLQGWCGSADPRKRGFEVRHVEAEDMKKEMEEQRQKKGEERQEINSGVSTVALFLDHRHSVDHQSTTKYSRSEWSWCHF